ncbi:MAG: hypothetical protein H6657_26385 [Ardenticatenaceae bacterium]|nr:hypothetical protein [Ardenticatenaceae bacterium]
MKKQSLTTAILAIFLILGLIACSEPAATPTPTAIPSPPTTEVVTEAETIATELPPTNTAELVEATAVPTEQPADTPAVEPTEAATAVPTEPISYTITVDSPQPNQALTVASDFTFSGTVSPVPSQRLEVELVVNGASSNGESVLAFADVDPTNGSWQISGSIPPKRTGAATLHVRVAGVDVTVPVQLQLASDEISTIVTVNQPLAGDVVVAGQTLLISGESRNLIDDKIQVGLFGCPSDTDENLEANIEFTAGNGPWRAQIIIPETAVANCDTARLRVTTGGLTSNDPSVAWSSDQLLTLVPTSDERANLFTLWEPGQVHFTPGRATTLTGTAVNPVDGAVLVELVQNETVIASATAVPDVFGYWETSLTTPADAEPGEVQLRLSTGTGDDYRETTLPFTLGS